MVKHCSSAHRGENGKRGKDESRTDGPEQPRGDGPNHRDQGGDQKYRQAAEFYGRVLSDQVVDDCRMDIHTSDRTALESDVHRLRFGRTAWRARALVPRCKSL